MKAHYTARWIIGVTLFLSFLGLLMVGSASVVAASRDFGNKWHYVELQSGWLFLGLIGLFIFQKLDHRIFKKYATQIFIISIALLFLVLIPGVGLKILGARRWLNLGPLSFQPAEFAKLALSIYLAKVFSQKPRFLQLVTIIGGLAFLLLLEPDMGTAMVITGVCLISYLGAGGGLKYLFLSTPFIFCGLLLIAIITPYRLNRVKTFLDSTHDPLGASYQVRQGIIGLGSGGVFGVGLGQSRQKYNFLPEVTTDSIFAVVGEELGIVGALTIIVSYLALILLGLSVAVRASDKFSSILALCITSWLGIQAFINISALISIMPFTGIPLAFISYGGTSLLLNLVAAGMLANVARSIDGQPSVTYVRKKRK